jgi:hypothetical protein
LRSKKNDHTSAAVGSKAMWNDYKKVTTEKLKKKFEKIGLMPITVRNSVLKMPLNAAKDKGTLCGRRGEA